MPDLDYPVCQRHAVKIAAAVAAHVNDDSRIARRGLERLDPLGTQSLSCSPARL
jgi:hypothetical protein